MFIVLGNRNKNFLVFIVSGIVDDRLSRYNTTPETEQPNCPTNMANKVE